jgi:hypothetical protein
MNVKEIIRNGTREAEAKCGTILALPEIDHLGTHR